MNKKFELLIYDPDYSTTGHYNRYNKYFLKMLSTLTNVKKITYFGEKYFHIKKYIIKKLKILMLTKVIICQ